MTDTAATPAQTAAINAKDLATLAAGISRFLTRLSKLPAFQEAGLGLAEWSALTIIAEKGGITSRQLADILGVTAQRINQVTESLRVQNLITLSPATDDARKKLILITPSGKASLADINGKLLPVITSALGDRQMALRRANHMVNKSLMRIVPNKPHPARR